MRKEDRPAFMPLFETMVKGNRSTGIPVQTEIFAPAKNRWTNAQARDDFTQNSAEAVINGASSMPFANIEKLHDADIQISSTEGGIIIHIII